MRGVNYVVDITPDFEEEQYRVHPIDFDRQPYEGNGHVHFLASDLDRIHGTSDFSDCKSMGELTAEHISLMLGV